MNHPSSSGSRRYTPGVNLAGNQVRSKVDEGRIFVQKMRYQFYGDSGKRSNSVEPKRSQGKAKANRRNRKMSAMQNDLHENDNAVSDQRLDADAAFYHEMGEELYKKTIPFLNDVLSKLLTISVSLSAGTVFFLGDRTYPQGMRLVAIIMFMLAFGSALIGMIPYRASISYCCPNEVKKTVDDAIWWKDALIWATCIFIVLGVVSATAGFFMLGPATQN